MSEVDVGGMAAEVEPSCQYSITFCCCVTEGSRGAGCQNGIWHGSAYEAKVCHWISPCGKKTAPTDIHLHLLNSYGDQTVDVSTVKWWVVHSAAATTAWLTRHVPDSHVDFYGHSMQALIHCWQKCTVNNGDCWKITFTAENFLYQIVFLCSLYLL